MMTCLYWTSDARPRFARPLTHWGNGRPGKTAKAEQPSSAAKRFELGGKAVQNLVNEKAIQGVTLDGFFFNSSAFER